jgi:hypothetical protein
MLTIVRMMWLFIILSLGGGAVLWVAISAYIRVHRQMKRNAPKGQAGNE